MTTWALCYQWGLTYDQWQHCPYCWSSVLAPLWAFLPPPIAKFHFFSQTLTHYNGLVVGHPFHTFYNLTFGYLLFVIILLFLVYAYTHLCGYPHFPLFPPFSLLFPYFTFKPTISRHRGVECTHPSSPSLSEPCQPSSSSSLSSWRFGSSSWSSYRPSPVFLRSVLLALSRLV